MTAGEARNTPGAIKDLPERPRFPLGLAIAGIVGTGLALVASAGGLRWGAGAGSGDGLELAWVYVNVALVWTWLLVWPAVALGRERLGRRALGWDFAVLMMAAIPAISVAAFLSGVPGRIVWGMAALQLAIGMLAMGAMAWRAKIGPGVMGGSLTTIGVVLPVLGYVWAEFFPAAWQGWRGFIPVVAAARAAEGLGATGWWVAGIFGLVGFALWGTAPYRE